MSSTEDQFLKDFKTGKAIPLKSVFFKVEIERGYAQMEIQQIYENDSDSTLEVLYLWPYTDSFILNQIIVDFVDSTGKKTTIETKVEALDVAKAQYSDAIAEGKIAVVAYSQATQNERVETKQLIKIMLGNFKAKSKAKLTAKCSQKLKKEDLSDCFRLPCAFVPRSMG
jgi:hypothetical protein